MKSCISNVILLHFKYGFTKEFYLGMQKQILTEIELMLTSTLLPETCHVLGKKIVDGLIVILCLVQYLLKKGFKMGEGGKCKQNDYFL